MARPKQTFARCGHLIIENPKGKRRCTVCQYAANRDRARKIRLAVLALFGNHCNNPNCRWLNEDGTLGCVDERLLHLDHINGGGNQERKSVGSPQQIYKKVLAVQGVGYRLLCSNCNWLARTVKF